MTDSASQILSYRQQKGRALNAVAELLRKRLSVPNIYLNPPASAIVADVLAVDSAGSGDLHGVLIKLEGDFAREPGTSRKLASLKELNRQHEEWYGIHFRKKVREVHKQLMAMPAHFRYLAVPQGSWSNVAGELGPVLYSPDGIGRIGIISLVDRGGEPPLAELSSITPERFRLAATSLSRLEKRLINNSMVRADIEVRI
jgi:hypothetical protein